VSGADKYEIYSKAGKNGTYKKIATTKNLSYVHKNLMKGTKYQYKIRAYKTISTGKKTYSSYSSIRSVVCK